MKNFNIFEAKTKIHKNFISYEATKESPPNIKLIRGPKGKSTKYLNSNMSLEEISQFFCSSKAKEKNL